MENETQALNIVFMPPLEVFDFSISQCAEIARDNKVNFNLDGIRNFPHATIYQLNIPIKNLEDLIKVLGEVTHDILPQDLKFTQYEVHNGYIGASFLPTDSIRQVQKKIVEASTPLREGLSVLDPDGEEAKNFSDEQKDKIREFGFENLFEFYNPHITITCMKDAEKAEEVAQTLKWQFGEFKSTLIGLYERGEYGTCNKLIKEFKLAVGD